MRASVTVAVRAADESGVVAGGALGTDPDELGADHRNREVGEQGQCGGAAARRANEATNGVRPCLGVASITPRGMDGESSRMTAVSPGPPGVGSRQIVIA